MSEELKPAGTSNGSGHGYHVEARLSHGKPRAVGRNMLDGEWRQVDFDETLPGFGVPAYDRLDVGCFIFYLLSYEAAQALRWWFAAHAGYGVETRLVKHRIEYAAKQFIVGPQDEVLDRMTRMLGGAKKEA